MFRTVPLSIIRRFSLHTQQWYMSHSFADSLRAGSGGSSWSCSQTVSKPVWHTPLLRVQWKTPDDGHRNCPKHVESYSKNEFEKLMHLVGFIIRNYHDVLSPERLPSNTTGIKRKCQKREFRKTWKVFLHVIKLLDEKEKDFKISPIRHCISDVQE
jgi:hypothetical protein